MKKLNKVDAGITINDVWFIEAGRNYFHVGTISSLWKDGDTWVKLMLGNRELALGYKNAKDRDKSYNLFKRWIEQYYAGIKSSELSRHNLLRGLADNAKKACK